MNSTPPRPGLRLAARLLLAGVLVVLLSGTAVAAAFEWIGQRSVAPLQPFKRAEAPVLDKPKPGKAQTILLTGLDHRYADGKGTPSRSDTMILLRLDPKAEATTMLSLPRDLRVVIPGHGLAPQKLNGAWALGGARLLTKTLRTSLLGTPDDPFVVNDVVSVRFDAFAQAVNHFGCLYSDIDRQYLVPPGAGYAEIDQPAGYQLLCGQQALAYVRFRHQDSDITREARQANYLSEARTQIGGAKALTEGGGLLDAVGKYVQTNVRSPRQLLGIAKLAVNVVGKPTNHVTLGTTFATDGSGDVLTTTADLTRARQRFLHPKASKTSKGSTSKSTRGARSSKATGRSRKASRSSAAALPPTMTTDEAGRALLATTVRTGSGDMPIYGPSARLSRGAYVVPMSHGYEILDKQRQPTWPAYRMVASTGMNGQYYGIQGTAWRSPPILDLADGSVRLAGRTWKVQYDGRKIRRLIWTSKAGTYWISNTLTNDLAPREMYALARTFGRVPASG